MQHAFQGLIQLCMRFTIVMARLLFQFLIHAFTTQRLQQLQERPFQTHVSSPGTTSARRLHTRVALIMIIQWSPLRQVRLLSQKVVSTQPWTSSTVLLGRLRRTYTLTRFALSTATSSTSLSPSTRAIWELPVSRFLKRPSSMTEKSPSRPLPPSSFEEK